MPEEALSPIPALLAGADVLVCCGSGGVGKTTTAAALGLEAARHGRRAVVVTIDPAKRLADALGLDGLDDEVRLVSGVEPLGDHAPGTLHAAMLDTKASSVPSRAHSSACRRRRALRNSAAAC